MAKSEELKGQVKEAAGDLTDNDKLQREGKTDQARGKVKQVAEDVKDKVEDGDRQGQGQARQELIQVEPAPAGEIDGGAALRPVPRRRPSPSGRPSGRLEGHVLGPSGSGPELRRRSWSRRGSRG